MNRQQKTPGGRSLLVGESMGLGGLGLPALCAVALISSTERVTGLEPVTFCLGIFLSSQNERRGCHS